MNNIVGPRRMTSTVIDCKMGFPFGVDRPRDIAPLISRRRCWYRNNGSRKNDRERKNRKFEKSLRHQREFSERCSWLQVKNHPPLSICPNKISDQLPGFLGL